MQAVNRVPGVSAQVQATKVSVFSVHARRLPQLYADDEVPAYQPQVCEFSQVLRKETPSTPSSVLTETGEI